jgi:ABC-type multidrug transport system permease subunit
MTQAGNGAIYIQNIIAQEVANFQTGREGTASTPVRVVIRAKFNPNLYSSWFISVMQVVNNVTMLAVILTGAALIREREQGTVEHLLVMPVVPAEIMLSKIADARRVVANLGFDPGPDQQLAAFPRLTAHTPTFNGLDLHQFNCHRLA